MSMESRTEVSEALKRARAYAQKNITEEINRQKPSFHLCAPIGWINDPNGFSVYKGEYHLFYQYYPYAKAWGPMHWGHSVSKDLVSWKDLPAALAPDKDYDHAGCFSGSALEYQGQHVLLYTGVEEKETENGKEIRQTQCLAIGDGVDYQKTENNPVIYPDGLPQGSSLEDFRDPKIWQEGDTFYAVMGSRSSDGSGQIPVYTSQNLRNWSLVSILDKCENRYGKMWECPDFFFLGDKAVLLTSPQDMEAEGLEFHSGNGTLCIIGNCSREDFILHREAVQAIDYGLDFYAPQTTLTPDGRRVMIAWLQSWDNYLSPEHLAWGGMMTIPRELQIKGGRLYQNPIRELEQYRREKIQYDGVKIREKQSLEGIKGRQIDLALEIRGEAYDKFRIYLAMDEKHHTDVIYDRREGILTFDRRYSGDRRDRIHTREMTVEEKDGKLKLRILVDKYSVEIFVNDGEKAMSSLTYTGLEAEGIAFEARGEGEVSVCQYNMEKSEK